MYKTVDIYLQSVLRHFPLNRWLLLQTQQIQNRKLVQERRLPWHVFTITIRGRTFRGRIRWAVTHQTNFKFQPNLNPKIASRESMAHPTSFPRQFPRRRKEEAARTDWVCSKKCLLPDPPVGSRLLVGTSLLVKLSRRNRNQTLLFLIRIDLYLSAQVGSGGNERDECHPVDFNAPRGWIEIMTPPPRKEKFSKVYEKFDYNDLECQKKLICEVMREPEYFGNMSGKLKSGFQ